MTNTPSPTASAAMCVSDALDIVHELACLNQLDELEIAGDPFLTALSGWQRDALDTLGGLLFEHAESIDTALALPSLAVCAPVPGAVCRPGRDIDPAVPSNAVRTCLELGEDAALDNAECGADPDLLAGRARQQRAFAITRAFLSLHAEVFDAALLALAAGASADPQGPQGDAADPKARPVPLCSGASRARALN